MARAKVAETPKSALETLTQKQRKFVLAYLSNGFNATQAAIVAGYSRKTARSIGAENLTKPDIKAAIKEKMDEMAMPANEVLARVSAIAALDVSPYIRHTLAVKAQPKDKRVSYGDYDDEEDEDDDEEDGEQEGDIVTGQDGRPYEVVPAQPFVDADAMIRDGMGWAIKGIKKTKAGTNVELFDKAAALQSLMKHHGLLVERQEVTGKDGKPIEFDNVGLSDDERANRIIALLEQARARRDRPPPTS